MIQSNQKPQTLFLESVLINLFLIYTLISIYLFYLRCVYYTFLSLVIYPLSVGIVKLVSYRKT